MRLTIAYSKIKRNLVLINKESHQREAFTEWPIRLTLNKGSIYAEEYWTWKERELIGWSGAYVIVKYNFSMLD